MCVVLKTKKVCYSNTPYLRVKYDKYTLRQENEFSSHNLMENSTTSDITMSISSRFLRLRFNQPTKLILLTEDCYACLPPKEIKSVITGKKAIVSRCFYFLRKALHGIVDNDFEPYVDF